MLYAILNNKKVGATPKSRAECPLCEMEVFSKCGDINIWHWSHKKHQRCDYWFEPETLWHKNWKEVFGIERSEVILTKDGIKHFADILTETGVVIELQNAPIQAQTIKQRELFYGEKMLWIINGAPFKLNFGTYDGEFNRDWMPLKKGYINVYSGKFVDQLPITKSKNTIFKWYRPRKNLEAVKNPIFIDFGDESLFYFKEGIGRESGTGLSVSKMSFLKKYKGDISKIKFLLDENIIR